MKKVLYVITKSDVGGAQRYVGDLARSLDPQKFNANILAGGQEIRWLSNRVWWWAFFLNDWLAIIELAIVFKREHPHVIHLNSSKAGVIGSFAAGLYKLLLTLNPKPYTLYPRIVFTAHGWVFNPTNALSPLARACYIALHRIAARFCDVIINVSEHDRQLALRYAIAPERKLVTIYNGIDPNMRFLERNVARKEILNRLQLPVTGYQLLVNQRWVGSIGRLTKEKNYETLIAAAREVPDAYFFIIGSGPEAYKLKAQSSKSKMDSRIFFVSPSGDDATLLKAFDVFALSSIKEGLPYSLLEALAARLPAVVTNAGGMPEVAHQCPAVAIVPMQNPSALAEDIRAKLPITNHQLPVTNPCVPFTLAAMTTATERVYQEKS